MGPHFRFIQFSVGPQPITSSKDEKSTLNPAWQVWMMLVEIVGSYFRTILECWPSRDNHKIDKKYIL
jgi:hypothetical protein